MPGKITLVLGGVRSGKSAFAEELANRSGESALYLATGQAFDEEMADRIRRHRMRRPAHWHTLEEPLALAEALERGLTGETPARTLLLDSLDVWVANLLLAHEGEEFSATESLAAAGLESLIRVCSDANLSAIMVSSEVGLSPVPPNPLGRQFQDLLGTVNQRAAARADEVYLVVAGIPVWIKPG